MIRRRLAVPVLVVLAAAATTACEPPPPRLELEVTTAVGGFDDVVGDGLCTSDTAAGLCTLQAAVQEGNAAPHGADILVPGGTYSGASLTVTGDVHVRGTGSADAWITYSSIGVNPGARLTLTGINDGQLNTSGLGQVVTVAGHLVMHRSGVPGSLEILAAGSVVMVDSTVFSGWELAVHNDGMLLALRSTISNASITPADTDVLATTNGGTTHLQATAVVARWIGVNGGPFMSGGQGTCTGSPPVSQGFAHIEVPCGGVAQPGDASGDARVHNEVSLYPYSLLFWLAADSPLIDAIPLGDPSCDPSSVDLYGNPRGVDGDGDGVGGCDIGAIEYQPTP